MDAWKKKKKQQQLRFNEFLIASIGGLKNLSQGDYTIKENKINAEDFCGNIFFFFRFFFYVDDTNMDTCTPLNADCKTISLAKRMHSYLQ